MSKITLSNLKNIQEFQFFTDSSGVLLTQEGALYQFVGNEATLIKNPSEFTPSHIYFTSQNEGAVIGNIKTTKENPSMLSAW